MHVSDAARDYIRRLMAEAIKRDALDQDKCQTARLLDATMELEGLAKMKAMSLARDFVTPDDIRAMAVYVIGRRHVGTMPYEILDTVPIIEPR